MRKSNAITIGLLAASIASCNHHHRALHRYPTLTDPSWDDNFYVNNDNNGYIPMLYYYPIYIDNYYGYYSGHICNHTSIVYRTNTGFNATSGGRISRVSVPHGSIGHASSRGGFGSSAHGSSAS